MPFDYYWSVIAIAFFRHWPSFHATGHWYCWLPPLRWFSFATAINIFRWYWCHTYRFHLVDYTLLLIGWSFLHYHTLNRLMPLICWLRFRWLLIHWLAGCCRHYAAMPAFDWYFSPRWPVIAITPWCCHITRIDIDYGATCYDGVATAVSFTQITILRHYYNTPPRWWLGWRYAVADAQATLVASWYADAAIAADWARLLSLAITLRWWYWPLILIRLRYEITTPLRHWLIFNSCWLLRHCFHWYATYAYWYWAMPIAIGRQRPVLMIEAAFTTDIATSDASMPPYRRYATLQHIHYSTYISIIITSCH